MKEENFSVRAERLEWAELTESERELVAEAKQMTKHSYSPYSRFAVGAAVRLANGTIVRGSNQENAAYPSGLCAERTAVFAANANYPAEPVMAIAIACHNGGRFTAHPGAPCGGCRQVLVETEHRYHQPIKVLLYGEEFTYRFRCAADLLPLVFTDLY
ncbi:MAG: cytidine deaminase [Paludibacteraceae bacterium]|nr:cytidine deaminase [Paludibacteraceae bacterium]